MLIKYFHKYNIAFIFVLLISAFLRFYRIEENFPFIGEVGHNLIEIRNYYLTKRIPLIGPPTSHEWLSFGPLFYWIYGPVLILSNFNPLSHAYFGAIVSLFTVIANFIVIRKIVNPKTALLSSYLIGISPLFLEFSKAGRFFSIVALLIYPFLYFLYNVCVGKINFILPLGIIFGLMFNFHFTPIMLVPFLIAMFIIRKNTFTLRDYLKFLLGFLLANLPFFIYDLTNNLNMTSKVILWVPYRIAGFFGLYPKNNLSVKVATENINSFSDFITKSLTPDQIISLSLILIITFILIITKRKSLKKFKFSYLFLILWFMFGLISVFIHGIPPLHYFVPILSAPIIFLSILITSLYKLKYGKLTVFTLVTFITIINLNYYFSNKWFYLPTETIITKPYYVPYALQQNAVKAIEVDSKGQKISLVRVGEFDYFEGYYAQNYTYLLELSGSKIDNRSKIKYTIYENRSPKIMKEDKVISKLDNIFIIKRID